MNKIVADQQKIDKKQTIPSIEVYKLKPNKMQVSFISNLQKLCAEGAGHALLISATGVRFILMTGRKTLKIRISDLSFLFEPTAWGG